MLLAPQQFTSFVNRRKYKILCIGDKNMWYGGGSCGSQSLWCLPLSSPPYILDNLPCSLVCLASKLQTSTCLLQHNDHKHLKSLRPSCFSTSCARSQASEGAGGSGSWELSWVCVAFPLLLPGGNGEGHTAATVVIDTAASEPLYSLAVTTWAEWGTFEESLMGYPTE